MSLITVELADYRNRPHRVAIERLMDEYASDPAIGGRGLAADVRRRLVDGLAARVDTFSLLAIEANRGVGLINAIEGYSTFAARPVLNLHDVMVSGSHRGRGVGARLMRAAEDLARSRGCCKITLEVYRGNATARRLYERHGFESPVGARDLGETLFLSRPLVG